MCLLMPMFQSTACPEATPIATHPHTMSGIRSFVDALTRWVEAQGDTTIDMLFIIARCTERTVIFYLRLCMDMPNDDPVLLRNDVIGWQL